MPRLSSSPPARERIRPTRDEDRFLRAWSAHRHAVAARCRRTMHRSRLDADEAVARTALRVYRELSLRTTSPANLRAWMLRIAYSQCIDLHREAGRRREQSYEALDSVDQIPAAIAAASWSVAGSAGLSRNPATTALENELSDVTSRWIDELPSRLQTTLRVHLDSRDANETARILGIQPANARKRIQQARDILRRRLVAYRSSGTP